MPLSSYNLRTTVYFPCTNNPFSLLDPQNRARQHSSSESWQSREKTTEKAAAKVIKNAVLIQPKPSGSASSRCVTFLDRSNNSCSSSRLKLKCLREGQLVKKSNIIAAARRRLQQRALLFSVCPRKAERFQRGLPVVGLVKYTSLCPKDQSVIDRLSRVALSRPRYKKLPAHKYRLIKNRLIPLYRNLVDVQRRLCLKVLRRANNRELSDSMTRISGLVNKYLKIAGGINLEGEVFSTTSNRKEKQGSPMPEKKEVSLITPKASEVSIEEAVEPERLTEPVSFSDSEALPDYLLEPILALLDSDKD